MVAGKMYKKIIWGEISETGSIPGHLYEYDEQGNLLYEEALVDDENSYIIDYGGRMRLQNILKDLPKISEENEEDQLHKSSLEEEHEYNENSGLLVETEEFEIIEIETISGDDTNSVCDVSIISKSSGYEVEEVIEGKSGASTKTMDPTKFKITLLK